MTSKNRKRVFCEFAFLKRFRDAYEHLSASEGPDALRNLLAIDSCLEKLDLMVDVDYATFFQDVSIGSRLFMLLKKSQQGDMSISYVGNHPVKDIESYIWRPEGLTTSYMLTKQSGICRHYREKYCVSVLSPECWTINETAKEYAYYFNDCGSVVNQRVKHCWSNIFRDKESHISHCNSMLIVDNYINKNLNENLLAILDALLPKILIGDIEFQLTIITQSDDPDSYKDMYDEICKFVKKSRPELRCHVELYVKYGKSGFHDRTIITNNAKIDSGAGFSLIENGKAKNSTEVKIVRPYLQNFSQSCDATYNKVIVDVRRVVDEIEDAVKRKTRRDRYWPEGSSRNRLLREE